MAPSSIQRGNNALYPIVCMPDDMVICLMTWSMRCSAVQLEHKCRALKTKVWNKYIGPQGQTYGTQIWRSGTNVGTQISRVLDTNLEHKYQPSGTTIWPKIQLSGSKLGTQISRVWNKRQNKSDSIACPVTVPLSRATQT